MNISVIIASRNRESYIKNLLLDLQRQKILPAEILVIDQSNISYNLDNFPSVVHVIDKELGPCHARNLGIENSKGDILVFLDDDIRINSNFLNNLCKPIIDGRHYVVVGAILDIDGNYQNTVYPYWRREKLNWLLALGANPNFPGNCLTLAFSTGCSAIHRSIYEAVGGFDLFFDPNGAGEDREYGLRIFHAGYSIFYEGKASVRHLAAPRGGRRSQTGYMYLNPLEANSVYIVAKYFGWQTFNKFCDEWLRSIVERGKYINPRKWIRIFRRWNEAKEIIKNIKKIKEENEWK